MRKGEAKLEARCPIGSCLSWWSKLKLVVWIRMIVVVWVLVLLGAGAKPEFNTQEVYWGNTCEVERGEGAGLGRGSLHTSVQV